MAWLSGTAQPTLMRQLWCVRWVSLPLWGRIQPSVLHRRTLVVDGYRGELLVDPEPVLIQEYQRLISEEIELSRLAEDDVNQPAQLKSGERVKVMLNAGLSPEHEEKLGSRIDGMASIAPKSRSCCKADFLQKKNRLRSIRVCCKCLTAGEAGDPAYAGCRRG